MSSIEEVQQGLDQIATEVTEVGSQGQELMTGKEYGGLAEEYSRIGAIALQLAERMHGLAERHASYGEAMSPLVEKIGDMQNRAIELTKGSPRQPGTSSLATELAEFMDPFLAVAQYFPVDRDMIEREIVDLKSIGRTFGEWGLSLNQRTQDSRAEITRKAAGIQQTIEEKRNAL